MANSSVKAFLYFLGSCGFKINTLEIYNLHYGYHAIYFYYVCGTYPTLCGNANISKLLLVFVRLSSNDESLQC